METKRFDADGVGVNNGNYFGMPFSEQEAELVLISIPWDVTASYGGGASAAPDAIIEASVQLDFYDENAPSAWKKGIATVGIDYAIQERSLRLRSDARKIIEHCEGRTLILEERLFPIRLRRVNEASEMVNRYVQMAVNNRLKKGKCVGVIGGDHSVAFGAIKAMAEHYGSLGVLQFDAHADLRECYEGFNHSHASIMWNVLNDLSGVERIVQIGVRDQSEAEHTLAVRQERIEQFTMMAMHRRQAAGERWSTICEEICAALPQRVYISFDIDALDVQYCPGTGTPVPGGLTFDEARYLIDMVRVSGREIVGFDLCEVSPAPHSTLDANVGARILFALCGATLK